VSASILQFYSNVEEENGADLYFKYTIELVISGLTSPTVPVTESRQISFTVLKKTGLACIKTIFTPTLVSSWPEEQQLLALKLKLEPNNYA
jgi:hypothetical protein